MIPAAVRIFVSTEPADMRQGFDRLAQKVKAADLGPIDIVVSPAVGGIVPGYETARHLAVPAVWVEREGGDYTAHPAEKVIDTMIEIGRPSKLKGAGFYEYDEGVDPADPAVRDAAEEALASARDELGDR